MYSTCVCVSVYVYDCMRVSFFLVSSCCMEVKVAVAVAVARTVFSICFLRRQLVTLQFGMRELLLALFNTCCNTRILACIMYVYVCMQYVKLTRQTPSNGAFSSLLSLPHSLTPRDVAGELVKLWAQLFRSLSLLLRPFTRS